MNRDFDSVNSLFFRAALAGANRRADKPQIALLAMVTAGFIIYIPVALLSSNLPLVLFDVLLWLSVVLTIGERAQLRHFGGSALVGGLAVAVFMSLLLSMAIDRPASVASTIQGARSVFYGLAVLFLSSAWLSDMQSAERFLRIYAIGSVFVVLYALRQVTLGLLPFEIDRLALMGASGREIEVLGRTRIPSTFGDAATFAWVMMLGVVLFQCGCKLRCIPAFLIAWRRIVMALLLAGLGMTLTRAPLVGLAAALIWILVSGRTTVRKLWAIAVLCVAVPLAIVGINRVVTSGVLAQSDVQWVKTADNVISSVWTLLPSVASGEVSDQLNRLRGLSASSRLDGWKEGLGFLVERPLGGGVGRMTEGGGGLIAFSPVDVGMLRYGLELGWLGLAAMTGLWAAVFWVGLVRWRRVRDARTHELGRYLLAAWIAMGVAQCITSFMHTEMIAVMAWVVAGLLLNLDRISQSSELRVVFHEQERGLSR